VVYSELLHLAEDSMHGKRSVQRTFSRVVVCVCVCVCVCVLTTVESLWAGLRQHGPGDGHHLAVGALEKLP